MSGNITVLQGNIVTINNEITALQQGTLSNIAMALPIGTGTITSTSVNNGIVSYTVTQGTAQRSGRVAFSYNSSTSTVTYDDEYTQTAATNLNFTMTANSTATTLRYDTTSAITNSSLYYRIQTI